MDKYLNIAWWVLMIAATAYFGGHLLVAIWTGAV